MAITIYDRVQETTTTSGTGSITLNGAVAGFLGFAGTVTNGAQTYYGIVDTSSHTWEIGIGTFTSPSTLSRDTVLASTNSGSKVNFAGNSSSVFIDVPASKRIQVDSPIIGTSGQSVFYGDGSNLTGVLKTTPTLQQVTDSGATTTTAVTFGNIKATGVNSTSTGANTIGTAGLTTFYGSGANLTGIPVPTLQQVTASGSSTSVSTSFGTIGVTTLNATYVNSLNVNASAGASNTIGTAGRTTFYGDGSNLTGIAGSTPTLQSVTDTGATTTTEVTFGDIRVININNSDGSTSATTHAHGNWSDSSGNVTTIGDQIQNSHADSGGTIYATDSHASAGGTAGKRYNTTSAQNVPTAIIYETDVTSYYSAGDTVILIDSDGNTSGPQVITSESANGNTLIAFNNDIAISSTWMYNLTTSNPKSVQAYAEGNLVFSGDATSIFPNGASIVIIGTLNQIFQTYVSGDPFYSGTTTTITPTEAPEFDPAYVFNNDTYRLEHGFAVSYTNVSVSGDVTNIFKDGDNVVTSDDGGTNDTQIAATAYSGESDQSVVYFLGAAVPNTASLVDTSNTRMVAIGDSCQAINHRSVAIGYNVINTTEESVEIGADNSAKTSFDSSGLHCVSINTTEDAANYIGTAGQTVFYGDASNLSGIPASTLQQVTDAGSSTTTQVTFDQIRVNSLLDTATGSTAAAVMKRSCWTDSNGAISNDYGANASHADSGGMVKGTQNGHAAAGGVVGTTNDISAYTASIAGPTDVLVAGDVTAFYSYLNSINISDGLGGTNLNLQLNAAPTFDGTHTILHFGGSFPSVTEIMYNQSTTTLISVDANSYPTLTFVGDRRSSFANGHTLFCLGPGLVTALVPITSAPNFSGGNTTITIGSDPGFNVIQAFDATTNHVDTNFSWGTGDSFTVSGDVTAYYTANDTVTLGDGTNLATAMITSVSYDSDADATDFVLDSVLGFTPTFFANNSRSHQVAIGNGATACGHRSISIGNVSNLSEASVAIGYSDASKAVFDDDGIHATNINASEGANNSIGTTGFTTFYGDGSNLTGISSRAMNTQNSDYTLAISDAGKMVVVNSSATSTLTIPLNASVALPIGTEIDVVQLGTGQVTIGPDSGVTLNSFNSLNKLAGQYGAATLKQTSSNTWLLVGNLTS